MTPDDAPARPSRVPGPERPRTGSFTLERDLDAPASAVYAAFTDPDLRRRWIRLPGKLDPASRYEARAGAVETLRSSLRLGDTAETVESRTYFSSLVPGDRLIWTHEAIVDERLRWVSLVTVRLTPRRPTGTHLTWTEQYVFVELTGDGEDDAKHLRGGVQLQLNGLPTVLRP